MSRQFMRLIHFFNLKNFKAPLFVLTAIFFVACTKKETPQEVNLAIWGNYFSEASQKRFTEKTGIKLNISNYSSNEELLAKIQSGASGLDVAVPSDYMVEIMIKSDLLTPLNSEKIPNKKNISQDLLAQPYDVQNQYSLPYAWSTAGIAVHRDLYKGQIKSWKDLFESKELNGKISLLDDVREVLGAALKYHGYSVNTLNPAELEKAKKTLKDFKPKVKMFRSDTIEALLNKEVAVAHAFSSDALQASQKSQGKIEYIIPSDGATRAIDNVVLVKGGKNSEAAHALINFFLEPEVNQVFVETSLGGPVIAGLKDKLPLSLQNNTALFPISGVVSNLERIQDLGDNTKLYDDIWTELKVE